MSSDEYRQTHSYETITSLDFRDALSRAATAVTVVATDGSFGLAGMTCSAVCVACDAPPTLLMSVGQKSYAAGIVKSNRVLSVNWLAADQSALSQTFAGVGSVPMLERFKSDDWQVLVTGAPCLRDATVAFDCAVVRTMDIGSHSVILAEVVARMHFGQRTPLIYHQRKYATALLTVD